jgi:hypothetical protein
MRQQHIDAYLILTHDDYFYFFGEDRVQPRAILPAGRPPIIVTFRGEEAEVRERLAADDVRVFGSVAQQMKDIVEIMRELGGPQGGPTVGVQMGFFTPAFLLALFQKLNPPKRSTPCARPAATGRPPRSMSTPGCGRAGSTARRRANRFTQASWW